MSVPTPDAEWDTARLLARAYLLILSWQTPGSTATPTDGATPAEADARKRQTRQNRGRPC